MECIVHGVTKSQTWLSNFHFHIVTYEPFYPCVPTVHNSTQYSQQSILWKSKISHPTAAAAAKSFQLCSTLCHPIWQPTRLPRPWDSPGKNAGVGCHCLLQCMKVKSQSEVAQSCPTLSDPMDYSPPGSSVHGIFQARVLEWGAIAFSKSLDKWAWIWLWRYLCVDILLVIYFSCKAAITIGKDAMNSTGPGKF